jgi:signal transduction histidine kinase
MKISLKIIILTSVLLLFLGGNAFLSWYEISRINKEINKIVKDDLQLMESSTTLNELQLKKQILFEKLANTSEELAFGNANESRKQYLLDFVTNLREEFQNNSILSKVKIEQFSKLSDLDLSLKETLVKVNSSINAYDQEVEKIFISVKAGTYQLSMEDLYRLSNQQSLLSKDIQTAMTTVWKSVRASIKKINRLQGQSRNVLYISLVISLVFGLVLSFSIIQNIHRSLNTLLKGVRQLQQGNLGIHVPIKSSDEIGELSHAFNHMSDQLKAFQDMMQKKNVELATSLKITQEQKTELEKINRDLDRFVHLISHDIYGPITAIILYSDALAGSKGNLDPKSKEMLDQLDKVSHRLSAMVLDLLEMTKITRMKSPFERLNIGQILQEAIQRQEFNIQKTGAVIHAPQDLPVLLVDRIKLTIVFYNLIGNAIKYSSKNGNKPEIEISCQKREKDYVFCIKDNGIGIDPQYFNVLFTIFKRLPGSEDFQGTGVGLAVVKEIIQEHGGQIWVESAPNQGSRFFFSIPLETAKALS